MAVLALISACLGMACVALAMRRHHRQVFGRDPSTTICTNLRMAGAAGLAVSLIACAEAWGWPIGSVAWFGMLSAGAWSVVVLLATRTAGRSLAGREK